MLRESNRGYGILVSSVRKESSAFYSLRDPTEVQISSYFICIVSYTLFLVFLLTELRKIIIVVIIIHAGHEVSATLGELEEAGRKEAREEINVRV